MTTKKDYFKGSKKDWRVIFNQYHKTPMVAERESEERLTNVKFCEWYVTIDGDINFGTVNPIKNGKIDWNGLNDQVRKFIENANHAGEKYLIEITTRDTDDGLLDNHYVTGDKSAIEG